MELQVKMTGKGSLLSKIYQDLSTPKEATLSRLIIDKYPTMPLLIMELALLQQEELKELMK
jgi:hypothetical protein